MIIETCALLPRTALTDKVEALTKSAQRRTDPQWQVILQVAHKLNLAGIPYHFDASTILFVHGIEIEMDDVDISIQWDEFEVAHDLFADYCATPIIEKDSWHQFRAIIDGVDLHFLSAKGMMDLKTHSEREQLFIKDTVLWSKTVTFYRRHMDNDHPWIARVDQFLQNDPNSDVGTQSHV